MGRDAKRRTYDGRSTACIMLKDIGAALKRQGTSLEDERTNFRKASSGNGRGRDLFEKMELEVEPIRATEKIGPRALGIAKWIAVGFASMTILCAEPPQVDLSEKARQLGIAGQQEERKNAGETRREQINQVKKEMRQIIDEDAAREADKEMREDPVDRASRNLEMLLRQLEEERGPKEERETKERKPAKKENGGTGELGIPRIFQ
jgi:hypothetical protein